MLAIAKAVEEKMEISIPETNKMGPLFDFLSLENKEEIGEEQLKEVRRSTFELWKQTGFDVIDVSSFVQSMEFILSAEVSLVESMLKLAGIAVSPKNRKFGREAYYKRLVMNYHKHPIRNTFDNMFIFLAKEEVAILKEDYSKGTVDELVNKIGFEQVYWIAARAVKTETLLVRLQTEYPVKFLNMLIVHYLLYVNADFDTIMNYPEKLENEENRVNPHQIMNENKKLRNEFKKSQKQEQLLKQQNYLLLKKQKELKGEIHTLFNQSLVEIEDLKKQNEELLTSFAEERRMYINKIEALSKAQLETTEIETPSLYDLNGQKIAVIGGNKKRHYADVIKKYNGSIIFVSEDDFSRINGMVSKSNAVFFLTPLNAHRHSEQALSAAESYDVPFIYVNSKGISEFETELKKYMDKNKEQ